MNALTPIEASAAHDMPAPIAEAISKIMATVKNVEKNGENKFHNYKFAKVEDLIFQVQPAMAEAGLIITQDEIGHEIVSDALMLATYGFGLSHKSGVTWAASVHQTGMASLKNTKGGYDDKALNKCHTAARKYFILGLFQIPAGDLPDADVEEDKPAPERQATPSLEERAITHLRSASIDKGLFKDAWEKNSPGWKATLDRDAYARVVAEMKKLAGAFPKDEPAPPPPPAEDFGLGGDEIPQFN